MPLVTDSVIITIEGPLSLTQVDQGLSYNSPNLVNYVDQSSSMHTAIISRNICVLTDKILVDYGVFLIILYSNE